MLFFASGFASSSEEDLAAAFPPNLSAVLKRVADAKCIPYRAMISGMIMLVCAFSPASWCSSVGGHSEPVVMYLKNLGLSGINKTGAMRFFEHFFFCNPHRFGGDVEQCCSLYRKWPSCDEGLYSRGGMHGDAGSANSKVQPFKQLGGTF